MKKILTVIAIFVLAAGVIPCQAQNRSSKKNDKVYEGSKSFRKCMPAFDEFERQINKAESSQELMSLLSDFYSDKNPMLGDIDTYSDMTLGEMSQMSQRFSDILGIFMKKSQELGGMDNNFLDGESPLIQEFHQYFGSEPDSNFNFSFDIDLGPDSHYHYDSKSDPNFDPNSGSNFHFEFGPGAESDSDVKTKSTPAKREDEYEF